MKSPDRESCLRIRGPLWYSSQYYSDFREGPRSPATPSPTMKSWRAWGSQAMPQKRSPKQRGSWMHSIPTATKIFLSTNGPRPSPMATFSSKRCGRPLQYESGRRGQPIGMDEPCVPMVDRACRREHHFSAGCPGQHGEHPHQRTAVGRKPQLLSHSSRPPPRPPLFQCRAGTHPVDPVQPPTVVGAVFSPGNPADRTRHSCGPDRRPLRGPLGPDTRARSDRARRESRNRRRDCL